MRSMADFVLAACLLASVPTVGTGAESAQQSPPADSASVQAAAAYDAKDWVKSAQLYEPMVKAHPEITALAVSAGDFTAGIGTTRPGFADHGAGMESRRAAGVCGVLHRHDLCAEGDKEMTFEHLQKAPDAGYNKLEQFDSDAHLASLRGDPRLAKMRQEVEHNLKPCASTPEDRQCDFCLGAWNVQTTQGGVPAGQSKIELILGDCVIQENWQSDGNPYSGKSYNIYNTALKRWEQFWVDNSAGNIFFYGD
jgi:hypothetical protein